MRSYGVTTKKGLIQSKHVQKSGVKGQNPSGALDEPTPNNSELGTSATKPSSTVKGGRIMRTRK